MAGTRGEFTNDLRFLSNFVGSGPKDPVPKGEHNVEIRMRHHAFVMMDSVVFAQKTKSGDQEHS